MTDLQTAMYGPIWIGADTSALTAALSRCAESIERFVTAATRAGLDFARIAETGRFHLVPVPSKPSKHRFGRGR